MSGFSCRSDSSSSSYTPITPHVSHHGPSSSPTTHPLATPPSTLRQYGTALKAQMRAGMKQAMAELKDEGREPERQFDVEFGYDDEDPIERHVKQFLSPRKADKGRRRRLVDDEDENMSDLEDAEIIDLNSPMPDSAKRLGPFQPGLIHFRKSVRPAAPFARHDSGNSTPGSGGSGLSEASFEAIRTEDYVSMYGNERDRLSFLSTSTASSAATVIAPRPPQLGTRPSLLRPRPRAQPYPEGRRQREHSGEMARGLSGGVGDEEDWLSGRTISETMVAKAGLKCQRGRNQRR